MQVQTEQILARFFGNTLCLAHSPALIDALRCLPGIGPKSAQRIAFHLVKKSRRQSGLHLSTALSEALSQVGECEQCNTYTEEVCCSTCNNKRQQDLLCVVESPADIVGGANSAYSGLYHVLHGHLSPLDGVGPQSRTTKTIQTN